VAKVQEYSQGSSCRRLVIEAKVGLADMAVPTRTKTGSSATGSIAVRQGIRVVLGTG